jgi:hypothetical protein
MQVDRPELTDGKVKLAQSRDIGEEIDLDDHPVRDGEAGDADAPQVRRSTPAA